MGCRHCTLQVALPDRCRPHSARHRCRSLHPGKPSHPVRAHDGTHPWTRMRQSYMGSRRHNSASLHLRRRRSRTAPRHCMDCRLHIRPCRQQYVHIRPLSMYPLYMLVHRHNQPPVPQCRRRRCTTRPHRKARRQGTASHRVEASEGMHSHRRTCRQCTGCRRRSCRTRSRPRRRYLAEGQGNPPR